jgi:hypothetical protein
MKNKIVLLSLIALFSTESIFAAKKKKPQTAQSQAQGKCMHCSCMVAITEDNQNALICDCHSQEELAMRACADCPPNCTDCKKSPSKKTKSTKKRKKSSCCPH